MNIDTYAEYLTKVLRCAICGEEAPEIPAEIDEDMFFEFCRFHKVENIVYMTLKDKLSETMQQKLFDKNTQLLMVQALQQYYREEIERVFEENGIDYLILKGGEIARLYPSEDMRQSSDIDIYIGRGAAPKARDLMLDIGFDILEYSDTNDDHDEYLADKCVMVELHRVLIQNDHPWQAECNRMPERFIRQDGTKHCMKLTPEDFYAYNLAHTAKHMKFSGIGIRAFLDQWIIYNHCKDVVNKEELDDILKRCNLYEFNKNAIELCNYWFEDKKNVSDTIKQMARYVAESGWVGTQEQAAATELAEQAGASNSYTTAKINKFKGIIFLPYEDMVKRYPILSKHRWLMIPCTIHRIFKGLFKQRELITDVSEGLNSGDMDKGIQIRTFKASIGL